MAAGEKRAFDLIIIGGGPAGLSAAIYALRARLSVLLVEKMVLGGLASTTFQIENYPGFPESISGLILCRRMEEQAARLGLEVLWGNAARIARENKQFAVEVDGQRLTARALILATGTEIAKLGVPGEEQLRGKGVSYCATCDGPFYKDKNIIVVGGGNAAVEEALFLTRYASKVSIVHRRDELRADRILAERAKSHERIYFFWHTVVERINGDQTVSEVVLKDLLSKKALKVPADGIFIYIGSQPNSGLVKDLAKLNRQGFVITDEKLRTSVPGLFAAGDIRAKPLRQIVTAAADGAVAADSVRAYLTS
jgi:thioredoxin reductase (NADPH)